MEIVTGSIDVDELALLHHARCLKMRFALRCTREDLVAAVREARLGGVPMPREIARKVIAAFRQPFAAAAEVEDLRPSERKIMELLAHGLTNKEIANRLGLSAGTVRWHLENIYGKLQVSSRTEAVIRFHSANSAASDV